MSVLKPGFGKLATLGEAFAAISMHLPQTSGEVITLERALHRVTSHDVISAIDVPHFPKAAMDGYAVLAADTFPAGDARPVRLDVVETVMPGHLPTQTIASGRCIEIGTGAHMPEGADAVVMVEQTESDGPAVLVRRAVAPGENIIQAGSDVTAGSVILRVGTRLEPRHIGALAAIGVGSVSVVARPVAVLFSTGPEITDDAADLGPGRILDINRHTLGHALKADGCSVIDLGIVPDDRVALRKALEVGLTRGDFVLLSGGSSLGGGDLVTEVFAEVGKLHLHGVAVKPGKPLVLGSGDGPSLIDGQTISKPMIGLPGYPMSALSDYYIFVRWMIHRAMGVKAPVASAWAVLGRKHASTTGRYEFLPVTLSDGVAEPVTKGSSAITALASADGFIEIDENTEVVEKGQTVEVRLF